MEVLEGKIYRHFKGNLYYILNIAFDTETEQKVVVYKALYGEGKVWVRPLKMFAEEVNKNNQKHRFELFDTENSKI